MKHNYLALGASGRLYWTEKECDQLCGDRIESSFEAYDEVVCCIPNEEKAVAMVLEVAQTDADSIEEGKPVTLIWRGNRIFGEIKYIIEAHRDYDVENQTLYLISIKPLGIGSRVTSDEFGYEKMTVVGCYANGTQEYTDALANIDTPPSNGYCLVFIRGGLPKQDVREAFYRSGEWCLIDFKERWQKVTHWMPMPFPQRGNAGEWVRSDTHPTRTGCYLVYIIGNGEPQVREGWYARGKWITPPLLPSENIAGWREMPKPPQEMSLYDYAMNYRRKEMWNGKRD